QALPLDGAGYEAIRISRNRYWGQPVMLEYIQGLAAKMTAAGQAQLYIGDIGQPRGGPAPSGHASHQVGLDADIWFERQPGARRAPADRENPPRRSPARAGDGCGEPLDLWFTRPPVKLPPAHAPYVPYRPKLPAACAALLKAP